MAGEAAFDPAAYKRSTTEQWQAAAQAWSAWGPALERWLGQATELMLDLAGVGAGARVLDVAAGAGGQTLAAARRAGPDGAVLATDSSSEILLLRGPAGRGRAAGQRRDAASWTARRWRSRRASYDAVISRLGLMYLPGQAARAARAAPGAAAGREGRARSCSRPPSETASSRSPSAWSDGAPGCRLRPAGPARPVQRRRRRGAGRPARRRGLRRRRRAGRRGAAADGIGGRMPAFRARVLRRASSDARRGSSEAEQEDGLAGDRARALAVRHGAAASPPPASCWSPRDRSRRARQAASRLTRSGVDGGYRSGMSARSPASVKRLTLDRRRSSARASRCSTAPSSTSRCRRSSAGSAAASPGSSGSSTATC